MNHELIALAEQLGEILRAKNLKIAIAESCTGGGLCQIMTEVAGSSAWFECGFVTYSNASKMKMLGVTARTLEQFGAVSAETALAMVSGTITASAVDCAIAITGIAGPSGGSQEKPVGTVFIALQTEKNRVCYKKHFNGTRHEIRQQVLKFALNTFITAETF
jgi:nicotinamide-nucleotide amidase